MTERRTQLNESVYGSIKTLILRNKLRPGVKLIHQELAEMLGVSRTPVRESLERLFQEGYVVRIPRRGYYVGEVGLSEVNNLYDVREAIEIFQITKFLEEPRKDALKELRAINKEYGQLIDRNITRDRLIVDRKFHITLASASGNTYIAELLATIFDRLILKRRTDGFHDTHGVKLFQEHEDLLDALEESNRPLASKILQGHIRGARLRFLKYLENLETENED